MISRSQSFFESKLKMLDSDRTSTYMLTGQNDFSGWSDIWRQKVFDRMKQNPKKAYIFLSKAPDKIHLYETPDNGWFGVMVTSSKEKSRIDALRNNIKAKHYHVTFEPLFEDIGESNLTGIEWIVIGTETGSRKNKSVTKPEWLWNIYRQAKEQNVKVFMKEDLQKIILDEEFVQEFPDEFHFDSSRSSAPKEKERDLA